MPWSCAHYTQLAVDALEDDAFQHVMVLDCERIVKEWPRESASRNLGPVAKPVTRIMQKLNPSSCTLAAFGPRSVQALLKLVAHKALPETTERLILGHYDLRGLPAHLRQLFNASSQPLVGAGVAITVVTDDAGCGDSGWSDIAAGFASAPTFLSVDERARGALARNEFRGLIEHLRRQRGGAGGGVGGTGGGGWKGVDGEDKACMLVEVEFNISWKTKQVQQTINFISEFHPSAILSASAGQGTGQDERAGGSEEVEEVQEAGVSMVSESDDRNAGGQEGCATQGVVGGEGTGGGKMARKLDIHLLCPGEAVQGLVCMVVGKESAANRGLFKCQVCDASGSITCLYTAEVRRGGKVFGAGKGTVLSLAGHVVSAQGRMLLMVSAADFPAAKVKTFESSADGYGHMINAAHPNNQSARPQCFAVLLLRGSKCVLARSLASPPAWPGNRLPQARAKARESGPEAAISAVCQQLDLDKEEFYFRGDLPPVVYFRTLLSWEV